MSETCCCFCLNLRSGSYLSAGYTIGLGLLGLIGSILAGINGGAEGVVFWITAAAYVLWIIFAILVIVGLQKNSRGWLLPWIVMTIVICVFMLITIITALIRYDRTFDNGGSIFNFLIALIVFSLNIYALYCVISLYRKNMNP